MLEHGPENPMCANDTTGSPSRLQHMCTIDIKNYCALRLMERRTVIDQLARAYLDH